MENFSTVLWIVVIAAAMIFNVVSQSRKQAKKQARQAGDRHAGSEAWPSWDPAAAPQPAPRKDAPVRQEVQPAMASAAGFEDAAPEGGSGHTAHLSGRGNAPKDRLTAAEHPHAAYDDAQEDVSAEIAEDFDLRRAVIYSEILKPKFDE
ncbi:hypothetical protein [Alistipes onderdonkii]|uniref:hypothetical protein n=1 Tax=Alistipes onderdonkii TaxID=328813 RepID=UPI00050A31C2|nr:hypothetical protein [Alistipes onderdonkii]